MKLCEAFPTVAFRVAVCAVLTAETVAWKLAVVAPAATVTEDGTFTADELLDRLTAWPPDGALAFMATVQLSVPALASEVLAQITLLGIACPVPLRAMVEVVPVEELLVRVTEPLTAPAVVGLKLMVRAAVCPAFRVSGKVAPERVKPEPFIASALTVTAPVPEEVSVTV